MGTKINPLDFGKVIDQTTEYTDMNRISMEVSILMVFDTEEDYQIVADAIIDNIRGESDYEYE